ncbi:MULTISPECIES: MFS transporter [Paenibacillus]|uniref:MFS transporter n=2 Tax=Paenibacillus TaxID=44249 RepID=A0A383RDT5_PAEAL|nr:MULTISPECIES: MFS transporter [Paenibacillus]EPY13767.1 major facilitator superfamily protein [Paenibacillus alvei A6-6i-x]MCM3291463.1 MFS transporter [Paenibacillus sp. MER 180]MCY9528025.1 MFS transporter [Paenibacillus alvei]MDT8975597.1 MFS transporter [Paenibacillus sp. chi10]OBY77351.1 MFS transporter [Paenibacillus sp. KS1]
MASQQSRPLWIEYAALATVPLVMVLGNSMLVPILPEVKRNLGLTSLQTSFIITLFSLSAAIIIPVAGYLSDRYGRKKIIIPGLLIYGIAGVFTGLGALWNSYPLLISSRAVQGLGAAGTAPIAMALVGDLYKDAEESKAMGLIEASNGAGKVISPILGAALALWTWTAPFFAFPCFCALSLVAIIWLIKEPKRQKEPTPLKTYLHNVGSIFKKMGRWLIPAFFAGSLALFILFGILIYLSDILEEKPYSIQGVVKGLVLAIPLLGIVTTAFITGSVIKKNGILIRRMMIIGLVLMSLSLGLTIMFHKQVYWFIALITISSIGTGMLLPCLNTMITGSVEKAERGMITSLYSSLRFFGVALGPPLFTWMMSKSHQIIFISVTALSIIALVLVCLFIKPDAKVQ